jgi:hypothetical protein
MNNELFFDYYVKLRLAGLAVAELLFVCDVK